MVVQVMVVQVMVVQVMVVQAMPSCIRCHKTKWACPVLIIFAQKPSGSVICA